MEKEQGFFLFASEIFSLLWSGTAIFKRFSSRQGLTDVKTSGFGSLVINLHKHAAAMWSLP